MPIRTTITVTLLMFAACQGTPMPTSTGGPLLVEKSKGQDDGQKPADAQQAAADKKAEERAARAKELRQKQRDLEYARVEQQTAAIDRQTRTMALTAAMTKAQLESDKARHDLQLFSKVTKAKDIEERAIGHQQSVYGAEHAKDELQELESMYEKEEFAKSTKELVLKRGRRQLEMAERSLKVSTTELEVLKEHTLVQKEKDLQQKVADTDLELKKADMEGQKVRIELDLQERKSRDRIAELEQDIKELQEKVAREQS
ncbi:MAG TPA: hypothetical protein VK348_06455 [Planctomycetota bacterium]|nr:hypothetical protein [Planctomycetota bacterium]